MRPKYDIEKIKYATDAPTFERAVGLYESGRVTHFDDEDIGVYSAVVIGTKPYRVAVEARRYGYGDCDCYLGQNDTLCKHMVAVAIYAVKRGKPLTKEEKQSITALTCSGKTGSLSKSGLLAVKKSVTGALRYVKAYNGPSRIWFTYQNSLSEGCNRLAKIVSDLPVGKQTADLLVDMLLRLDDKLRNGGVDDSDGTIGDFIVRTADVLQDYAKIDPACTKSFRALEEQETCFGWEEPLLKLIK